MEKYQGRMESVKLHWRADERKRRSKKGTFAAGRLSWHNAAFRPLVESSITRHSSGRTSNSFAAARNMSGVLSEPSTARFSGEPARTIGELIKLHKAYIPAAYHFRGFFVSARDFKVPHSEIQCRDFRFGHILKINRGTGRTVWFWTIGSRSFPGCWARLPGGGDYRRQVVCMLVNIVKKVRCDLIKTFHYIICRGKILLSRIRVLKSVTAIKSQSHPPPR